MGTVNRVPPTTTLTTAIPGHPWLRDVTQKEKALRAGIPQGIMLRYEEYYVDTVKSREISGNMITA